MAKSEKLERELFESERNFRLLVKVSRDYAIYMLDPNGIVTNWNAGAERIKGYKASEIVGRSFANSMPKRPARRACRTGARQRRARRQVPGRRLARAQGRHPLLAFVMIDAIYEDGELDRVRQDHARPH